MNILYIIIKIQKIFDIEYIIYNNIILFKFNRWFSYLM